MSRVGHSTRILRSPHPIELGNLPDLMVKVGRVNSIGLKLDLTITLATTKEFSNNDHKLRFLIKDN